MSFNDSVASQVAEEDKAGHKLFEKGTFFTGCNYWASHAGTMMWRDWRPDIVDADFARLAANGVRILRVFPLWPDFQPIHLLRTYAGIPMEYRFGEEPLPDDEAGQAGVSQVAVSRFAELAGLAEKHGLRLIVGLITGWMSSRLFVPPALEGLNMLTNPVALQWEVRFVKFFVKHFKDCPAITGWDLGNECNCMALVDTAAEAWNWISTITNAIKSQDTTRPVISGMHSLLPEKNWTIQDQAEVVDILTTHPYPYFTPYCDQEALNTMRTGLHAVAETLFYRGIGGKPCFVEELGSLGPMVSSDEIAADFLRNNLFTLWAHDCGGAIWWCANEQSNLTHAPYDWVAFERELGLFCLDKTPKPALREMNRFNQFVERFPGQVLPRRIVDGLCVLTNGQDTWSTAYSAFVLAKQAGLDIEFRYSNQPLGEADLYLLPSLRGGASISARHMQSILDRVKDGAVLYISMDNGILSQFSEYAGLRVITREKCAEADSVEITGSFGKTAFPLKSSYKLILQSERAEVLGVDQNGNPAFTSAQYGKGKVFFLNYPLETYLMDKPGAFTGKDAQPYHAVYRQLKDSLPKKKAVEITCPTVGVTEHPREDGSRIVTVINYEPADIVTELKIADGWEISDTLYGSAPDMDNLDSFRVAIHRNDAVVFTIRQTD